MNKSTTNAVRLAENIPQPISGSETHNPDDSRTEESAETHSVQLTEYQDNSAAVTSAAPMSSPDDLWIGTQTLPNQELKTVLSRSYQLGVYTWSSASAEGASIIGNTDALVQLLAIPNIAEKVNYFKYFRCKGVNLTFRLNSTQWHYGTLVVSSTVNNSHAWHSSALTTFRQQMNNRPVLIDATIQDAVDYTIEWKSLEQWFDVFTSTPVHIMTYRVDVACLLRMIGTTVKDVKLTVFANFIEPEVALPVGDSQQPLVFDGQSHIEEAQEKSENNSVLSSISGVADTAFQIFDSVSGVAEKLTPLLPFLMDKPSSLQPTNHVVVLPGSDMAGFDGLDTSFKLCGHQEAASGWSEGILGESIGNPTIYQCVRTPGYLKQWNFTTATAAGAQLTTMTISPDGKAYANGTSLTPTPLGWFSVPFKFWRGSMKFFFHFVTSTFITARLRFVWIPPGIAAPATIADNESGDYVSQVIEVSGTMDHCITIPWINNVLYKEIPQAIIQDHFSTGTTASVSSLGTLAVYLVTPIVTIDSAQTPTVTALTYVAAGEDWQFSNYSGNVAYDTNDIYEWGPTSVDLDPVLEKNLALEKLVKEKKTESVLDFEGQTAVFEVFNDEFPAIVDYRTSFESGIAKCEEYKDIASLCKRYTRKDLTGVGTTTFYQDWDWEDYFLMSTATTAGSLTAQGWLTGPFVNFRGGKRYKFTWSESSEVSTQYGGYVMGAFDAPGGGNDLLLYNNPSFFTSTVSNRWIEFEVPWVTKQPFVNRTLNSQDLGLRARVTLPGAVAVGVTFGRVGVSAGDDFAVGVMQACPILRYTNVALSGPASARPHKNE